MANDLSRRDLLAAGTVTLGAGITSFLASPAAVAAGGANQPQTAPRFKYCLNMATIQGQKLSLPEQIDVAAKAGYDGIEPWLRDIEAYIGAGGSLPDIRKRIADHGLGVESAIGFARWIVDDAAERAKGLEQAKRDMDLLAQIGGKRIAAPPVGATDRTDLNLFSAAERYRDLLELGKRMGVLPQVELWGFSKSLSRIGEVLFVAAESAHRDACVLTDIYHIYKGGSDFAGLRLINGSAFHVMHVNDYPAEPPRPQIQDMHRVYPGDGVAPVADILRDIAAINPGCILSLELFNRDYWQQDALVVAKTGLEKMRSAVAAVA